MTMQKVQRLEDIGRLPDNWNGYGARKFTNIERERYRLQPCR